MYMNVPILFLLIKIVFWLTGYPLGFNKGTQCCLYLLHSAQWILTWYVLQADMPAMCNVTLGCLVCAWSRLYVPKEVYASKGLRHTNVVLRCLTHASIRLHVLETVLYQCMAKSNKRHAKMSDTCLKQTTSPSRNVCGYGAMPELCVNIDGRIQYIGLHLVYIHNKQLLTDGARMLMVTLYGNVARRCWSL